jgi:hypothetical protein
MPAVGAHMVRGLFVAPVVRMIFRFLGHEEGIRADTGGEWHFMIAYQIPLLSMIVGKWL